MSNNNNDCHSITSPNLMSQVMRTSNRSYSRKTTGFVGLHAHSYFSLLDAFRSPTELVKCVAELGQPAIALTDHGGLWGTVELMIACEKYGITPIAGNEMYLKDDAATQRLKEYVGDGDYKVKSRYHQSVLAVSRTGYENLCKLTSDSYLKTSEKVKGKVYPLVTKEDLARHKEGLVLTSGCLAGLVCQGVLSGDLEFAKDTAKWYKDTFGDNYYIELQDHGIEDDQRKVNLHLVAIAEELEIGLVVTADSHYVYPSQKVSHKHFLRINKGEKFSNVYKGDFWHPSESEMDSRLVYLPDWAREQAMDNTVLIAQKVQPYTLASKPASPKFTLPMGTTPDEYLEQLCLKGLERIGESANPIYIERLYYELGILKLKGLADYFLIVQDYVNWAKAQKIPVGVGRGSGGGALACYVLNITTIDPIKHGLIFERFINPERESYPDIDVDFCMERRHEVVAYLQDKYGVGNVANIITFNKMESRSALKDAGWVLGVDFTVQNIFSKSLPVIRGKNIKLKNIIEDPTLAPEFMAHYEANAVVHCNVTFREWVDLAVALEGTVKSTGIHASGLIIGDESLSSIIPLQCTPDGTITSQYNMNEVEYMGILKMDILGLKTLTILDKAMKYIGGDYYDLEKIDINDSNALNLLATTSPVGIFQLEAAEKMIHLVKPTTFEEVADVTSLIRPGCFDMSMHNEYTAVKFGHSEPTYCTEKLRGILGSTHSQCLYQEQLLRICTEIAGFSLGYADNVRRGCGKKKKEVLEPLKESFVKGCLGNGESQEVADELWEIILASAGYSFNASHSKAYTIISMYTAWVRYYYPAQFFAALLSGQKDVEKFAEYSTALKLHNLKLIPPDINTSDSDFLPINDGVLFGLAYINGLGEKTLGDVFSERAKGKFLSPIDFFSRVKVSQATAQKLIKAGAFDSLESNRGKLLENLPDIFNWLSTHRKFAQKEQTTLAIPGIDWGNYLVVPTLKDSPQLSLRQRLENEKDLLGIALTGHILDEYKLDAVVLKNLEVGQVLEGVIVISEMRSYTQKNGGIMGFVTLEDILGNKLKCTVFSSAWSISKSYIQVNTPLYVNVKIGTYNGEINGIVNRIKRLN
jgi:DNA polymerase-3 subunit alpha